jgi:hypothetical protein
MQIPAPLPSAYPAGGGGVQPQSQCVSFRNRPVKLPWAKQRYGSEAVREENSGAGLVQAPPFAVMDLLFTSYLARGFGKLHSNGSNFEKRCTTGNCQSNGIESRQREIYLRLRVSWFDHLMSRAGSVHSIWDFFLDQKSEQYYCCSMLNVSC